MLGNPKDIAEQITLSPLHQQENQERSKKEEGLTCFDIVIAYLFCRCFRECECDCDDDDDD